MISDANIPAERIEAMAEMVSRLRLRVWDSIPSDERREVVQFVPAQQSAPTLLREREGVK